MLLNDQQAAINELHSAFQEASDLYTAMATEIVDDADLIAAFCALAHKRLQAAEQLAGIAREMGMLPRMPDPDNEQLQTLVTKAIASLTDDERKVALDERLLGETHLLEQLDAALLLVLATETRTRLVALRSEVLQGIDTLIEISNQG